jgi:Rrf2 family nitric oxide-sensitive transcriptional repressor
MYLAAAEAGAWIRTAEVARAFDISHNHLQKAVGGLVRAGYVEALQGRTGGVRLSKEPAAIRLGAVVAVLEGSGCLVDCERGPCPLAGNCLLKGALDRAERTFTLADVVVRQTGAALRALIASQA